MFDTMNSDAGLIDAMSESVRAESVAIARRLAAVGELFARRAVEWEDRALWCTDPFEAVALEVSAAQNISRGRAGTQIRHARDLRERLPEVAAVFAAGCVDYRMVATVISRTSNVADRIITEVDAALAPVIPNWMKLSGPKLADRIDQWIAKFDPDGVRVLTDVDESRYVEVAPTVPGMGGIWANIHAADAAAFDQRLDALAGTVCRDDPRTAMQRRSDAIGAMAAGAEKLLCACGSADCPALGAGGAAPVVIHVLAEQATVEGTGSNPGYLLKFGIQPAESVRRQVTTARLKPMTVPNAAPGYRPSTALREFIRWRDLTCRWPGCDAPVCDTDHTVPYPAGPTSRVNLKLYCRAHHLAKTFYSGPDGWSEQQLPDGTMVFTSPTGHRYMTEPAGGRLFPLLGLSTDVPEVTPFIAMDTGSLAANRGLAMPTRKRTRDEDRRARIDQERRRRAQINAERAREHAIRTAEIAATDPPPF
jgi:hypothetical protein